MQTKDDIIRAFETGMAILSGVDGPPDQAALAIAASSFSEAASQSPMAKAKHAVMLALGAGVALDDEAASEQFVDAAMSGHPGLLRELAMLLLIAPATQHTEQLAAGLLRRAASAGDWIAAFLILREAQRERYLAPYGTLQTLAIQLSESVPFAHYLRANVRYLERNINPVSSAPFDTGACLQAVRQALVGHAPPEPTTLATFPQVTAHKKILQPIECDYIIARSVAHLQPSKVIDPAEANAIQAHFRTSEGATLLPANLDLPLISMMRSLSKLTHKPVSHGEFLAMLRYAPGHEYKPHHDYLEQDRDDYSKIEQSGQRALTVLIYLNDGYEGGETNFPQLNLSYKGAAGDCLAFQNCDDAGDGIAESLHAGLPVKLGEKWLATLWVRQKVFWPPL